MAKSNLADKAYTIIQQRIFSFDLFPGQTVSDYLLSKELGMSRTPIRQALQQLESEGLLEPMETTQSSYRVVPITAEDIQDIFDFREGLESTAIRLALEKGISEEQLQELEEIIDVMVKTNREDTLNEHFIADQRFHNSLVALSRNRRLVKAHDSILLQLTRLRLLSFLQRSLQDKACNEHRALLCALRDKNLDQAIAIDIHHLRTSRDDYIAILNNNFNFNAMKALRLFMGGSAAGADSSAAAYESPSATAETY